MIEQIPASNADVERLSEVVHKGLLTSIAKLPFDDEQKILRPVGEWSAAGGEGRIVPDLGTNREAAAWASSVRSAVITA
jgi:hypothetical protein